MRVKNPWKEIANLTAHTVPQYKNRHIDESKVPGTRGRAAHGEHGRRPKEKRIGQVAAKGLCADLMSGGLSLRYA